MTTEAPQHKHQLWSILPPLRPTESPLNSLSQLIKVLDETGKDATAAINSTPQLLAEAIKEWNRLHPGSKLLLIVDQAEELVTLCHDEKERGLFLQLLIRAAIAHAKHLRIVFTLRSDFEPQIRDKFEVQLKEQQRMEPLLEAQSAKPNAEEEAKQDVPSNKDLPELVWRNARFIVPAMSRDELREAIEEPALTRVVFFKPYTLVDQLIDEVAQMPGALPLLSFALSELYLKLVRRYQSAEAEAEIIERAITQEDYVELGGVTRSLTQRADKEYEELVKQDPAYAQTIRNVMLRMVALGGDLARRRVLLSELNYPEPENTRVATVIQRFSAARLLTPDTDAQHQPTIEPAHDALIRGWSNIQNWKNKDQEELALQGLLTPAAQEWTNNKHKNGFLWDDNPRIILLKQVLRRKHSWLNFLESEFVKKSLQRRRNNRLRLAGASAGMIAALAGISIFASVQLQLSILREVERKAALVINQLSTEPLSSLLLAIEATDESASRLGEVLSPVQYSLSNAVSGSKEQNLLRGHEGEVFSVAFSPDSQLIASSGEDGTIRLWNLAGQSVGVFKGHEQSIATYNNNDNKNVKGLVFSPDGKNIVSGGDDGTVRLWDLQGNQLALLGQFSVPIDSVAFHPDGYKVAVSSDNEADAWLIDLSFLDLSVNSTQALQNLLQLGQSNGNKIRFTPDGKFIVKQAGGLLSTFNLAGELLDEARASSREGNVNCSLAIVNEYSPYRAGYQIYSGQCRHSGTFPVVKYGVEEFDLDSEGKLSGDSEVSRRELKFDPNCQAEIFSLDATSKGELISGCGDGVISMFRESAAVPTFLRGHTASVNAVAISPDEKHLVSADSNGTIRLWDLSDFFNAVELPYGILQYQSERTTADPYWDWTYDVAFDPKGEFWAIARQKAIMLFDMQGNLAARPFEHDDPVKLVAFNPKNRTILSVAEFTLRLWDLQGNLIRDFEVDQDIKSIAFSPDGQMIVSGDEEATLSLWSLSGQKVGEFKGHEGAVRAVAFSPDGQSIISGSDDHTLRLWNLQGNTLRIFKGHDDNVTSIEFSPDGKNIVSGSGDKTLRLWNLNGETTTLFRGHTDKVTSVAFNPTGTIIVSAGLDPAVRFWAMDGSPIAPPFEITETFRPGYSMAAISPDGRTIVSSVSEGDKNFGGRLFLIRGWNSWEEWLGKACDRLQHHPVLLNPTTLDQRKAHDACKRRSGANE